MTAITKDEWIKRAVKRYTSRSDIRIEDAQTSGEALFELNPETSPEDAVDEDMTYWGE